MSTTIYLATAGEYSDFRVVAAFTREEDARAYELADDVDEYVLHDGPIEVRPWWQIGWNADIDDREEDGWHAANPSESFEQRDFNGKPKWVQHAWHSRNGRDRLFVEGWDKERVRKVYSEQRAQYIATDGLSAATPAPPAPEES